MLIEIRHRLSFRYDDYVRESQMELRVEPRSCERQTLQAFHLAVGPPSHVARHRDWNGNTVHHLGIRDYHERIEIEARSVVDVASEGPGLDALGTAPPRAQGELLDFALPAGPTRGGARLAELERAVPVPRDGPLDAQVAAIARGVRERLDYVPGVTDWRSTGEEALEAGSGVCQDFAHVMLAVLRQRGIPSRYVSGYLDVGQTQEPAQSHAWIEVHGAGGWVGFDPTHDSTPGERYVRVATGRHYDDVPPNRGIYRGSAGERLEAFVECREIAPRDVATLLRAAADFDVPVYSELPARARPRGSGPQEQPPPAADGQQQQQQQ